MLYMHMYDLITRINLNLSGEISRAAFRSASLSWIPFSVGAHHYVSVQWSRAKRLLSLRTSELSPGLKRCENYPVAKPFPERCDTSRRET